MKPKFPFNLFEFNDEAERTSCFSIKNMWGIKRNGLLTTERSLYDTIR